MRMNFEGTVRATVTEFFSGMDKTSLYCIREIVLTDREIVLCSDEINLIYSKGIIKGKDDNKDVSLKVLRYHEYHIFIWLDNGDEIQISLFFEKTQDKRQFAKLFTECIDEKIRDINSMTRHIIRTNGILTPQ